MVEENNARKVPKTLEKYKINSHKIKENGQGQQRIPFLGVRRPGIENAERKKKRKKREMKRKKRIRV